MRVQTVIFRREKDSNPEKGLLINNGDNFLYIDEKGIPVGTDEDRKVWDSTITMDTILTINFDNVE